MSKFVDSILGHAIGDAMGVPIEFEPREKLIKKPVTKMLGFGNYDVPAGTWSDDTSMTLATITSIIENKGNIDYNNIADKFCDWINNANFTATGEIFDIGITTKYALMRYWNDKINAIKCGGVGYDENGNGSLMRILPIALYCWAKKLKTEEIISLTNNVSSITHAHEISKLGCYIYVRYVIYLLDGYSKEDAYNKIKILDYSFYSNESLEKYQRILVGNLKDLKLHEIQSTGYIVSTLEASLWVLLNTEKFSEAIIGAINLGDDTDTIGAIVGSMAGILYGYNSIPEQWIRTLQRKDYLIDVALKFEQTISTF